MNVTRQGRPKVTARCRSPLAIWPSATDIDSWKREFFLLHFSTCNAVSTPNAILLPFVFWCMLKRDGSAIYHGGQWRGSLVWGIYINFCFHQNTKKSTIFPHFNRWLWRDFSKWWCCTVGWFFRWWKRGFVTLPLGATDISIRQIVDFLKLFFHQKALKTGWNFTIFALYWSVKNRKVVVFGSMSYRSIATSTLYRLGRLKCLRRQIWFLSKQ